MLRRCSGSSRNAVRVAFGIAFAFANPHATFGVELDCYQVSAASIYLAVAMRSFQCRLNLVKSTERKLRWDENIDGTNFELYIPQWRVPEPIPPLISVSFYDATLIDTSSQLSPVQKASLLKAGLSAEQIREIDTWLPIERTPKNRLDRPIIAALNLDRVHTQTVRYSPTGDPDVWELGQPYVPSSELGFPYPAKLMLRVGWVYE